IIGTAIINDEYNPEGEYPPIWATLAIDGNLYVGSQTELSGEKAKDMLNQKEHPVPKLLAKIYVGPSIATPIFTSGNKIVAPTYNGLHLIQMEYVKGKSAGKETAKNAKGEEYGIKLTKLETFLPGNSFEATPLIWEDTLFCACRDGYLYSFG
ncbi:MAG: hypothetical protein B6D45_08760, partial [Ignavibacteriales bacterium UTCHB3]